IPYPTIYVSEFALNTCHSVGRNFQIRPSLSYQDLLIRLTFSLPLPQNSALKNSNNYTRKGR
ncbi:MAG: hypothetical protein KA206_11795, partial [Paludibacter sp.]|nr:hypothetical protein [Paludibacter sp.]